MRGSAVPLFKLGEAESPKALSGLAAKWRQAAARLVPFPRAASGGGRCTQALRKAASTCGAAPVRTRPAPSCWGATLPTSLARMGMRSTSTSPGGTSGQGPLSWASESISNNTPTLASRQKPLAGASSSKSSPARGAPPLTPRRRRASPFADLQASAVDLDHGQLRG